MKKILNYLGVLIVVGILSGCSTTYMANTPYDEVYDTRPAYAQTKLQPSQSDVGQRVESVRPTDNYLDPSRSEPDYRDYSAAQQKYSSGNQQSTGQEMISEPDRQVSYFDDNDNFNYDDYYDYSYSVRIKRFHRPVYGFGYYDDYYTNLYWYTYDPWVWGSSVYLGYDWWWWDVYGGPYFSLGFNWGWGSIGWHWGYPFSGWYYYPHFFYRYPWYPWYLGYGGWGYWAGYHHGFWDGWWGNYYNSFDKNSYYYGPRVSRNETSGARSGGGTFGEFYESKVNQRRIGGNYNNVPDVRTGSLISSQESLSQRRINASGNSTSSNAQTAISGGSDVQRSRINAANAATQSTSTQEASDNGSTRRITSGNNTRLNDSRVSDDNAIHSRTNGINSTISVVQNPDNLVDNSNQASQGRIVNVGGEQVRVDANHRFHEASAARLNPQDDPRQRQAQERYASPRADQMPPQRYDYNRYRRENPSSNREELARPRTQTSPEEGTVRNYTPPTYTQPKRSDVYTSPRNYNAPTRTPEVRQNQGEPYKVPEQSREPVRRYDAPNTPRQPYDNVPSAGESRRSYSPPAQPQTRSERAGSSEYRTSSSPSYSSPSSSPSYNAPMRSSGGFNSSGSGSSSGRRR